MKKMAIGALMLILPTGCIFYVLASGDLGILKTISVFAGVLFWTYVAVGLMYGGKKN